MRGRDNSHERRSIAIWIDVLERNIVRSKVRSRGLTSATPRRSAYTTRVAVVDSAPCTRATCAAACRLVQARRAVSTSSVTNKGTASAANAANSRRRSVRTSAASRAFSARQQTTQLSSALAASPCSLHCAGTYRARAFIPLVCSANHRRAKPSHWMSAEVTRAHRGNGCAAAAVDFLDCDDGAPPLTREA
jgi:hypothetical protein